MRSFGVTLSFLALAAAAAGQEGFRFNRQRLPVRVTMAECLGEMDVQEALGLSLDQRMRLRNLRSAPPQVAEPRRRSAITIPRGFAPSVLVLDSMEKALLPEQWRRLRQLAVRKLGHLAPLNKDVAQDLRLTEAQVESLRRVASRNTQETRAILANPPPPPEKGSGEAERTRYWLAQRQWSDVRYRRLIRIRRDSLSSMVTFFTPEQKKRWIGLVGRPCAERFLHPAATLQAEMWRVAGYRVGENPALADARLRMLSKEELLTLRRKSVRGAGAAALLFPEIVAELRLSVDASNRVYNALWDATLTPGTVRPMPETFLDADQRKKWQALVAL